MLNIDANAIIIDKISYDKLDESYQDDDFSKAYTTALYQTKGTIDLNVRVKSDENLEIDLLFISNPESRWVTEDLGVFDALMQVHPTIFVEHYSGYLKSGHIIRCVTRFDFIPVERRRKPGSGTRHFQQPKTVYVDLGNWM